MATYPDLRDKVVLVTGSSRGIGAAIARAFAGQGARVTLHGRDAVALAAIGDAISQDGGRSMQVLGDVNRYDQIEGMRRKIEEEFGPVDVLVANAGGSFTPPGPLEELTEDG